MNDAEVIVHKRNYLKLCILLIIMFKITSAIGTKINRSGVPTKTNILHQETFKSVYFCRSYSKKAAENDLSFHTY
jgi:hypothetical protein